MFRVINWVQSNGDLLRRSPINTRYAAIVQQHGEWWLGRIEEVPGVNSQGKTRDDPLDNLPDAREEFLEMNRAEGRAAVTGVFEEVSLST